MKFYLAYLVGILICSSALADVGEKAWAIDWQSYRNTHTAAELIAQSSPACLSEEEALAEASNRAASQVAQLLSLPNQRASVPMLSSRIAQGNLVKDRYVRKIEKPYGTLYQASLLIDSSPSQLSKIQSEVSALANTIERKIKHRDRARMIFSTASIAGIGLLCFGANLLTKGYFTWRLRLASLVAMIACVGGIHSLL